MSAANASFAKLVEYEQRARGADESNAGASQAQGDWAGLAFRIGGTQMVCDTSRVFESLPIPRVTRVPGTKPFILGLANVRGNLVTVIDLGRFLDGHITPQTSQSRLLAASLRGRPVALLVDEVFGQRNFLSNDASAPDVDESSPFFGLIRKQHRSGTDIWQELDLAMLFNNPDFLNGSAT